MMRVSCCAWALVACLSIAVLGTACGSSGAEPNDNSGGDLAAVAGVYVVDLDRSIAAIPASEITPTAAAERDARLRTVFRSEMYSLEIQLDGTFQHRIQRGQMAHTAAGVCSVSEAMVELTVTAVDGRPLPEDQHSLGALARDGESLVLSDGGRTFYLTRP